MNARLSRNALVAAAMCANALAWHVPAYAAKFEIVDRGDQKSPALISMSGDIVDGDAAKFRSIAAQFENAGVILNSPGGKTFEAINIGKLIKLLGYSTVVQSGATCNSGCALIFVAGHKRIMGKTAKVGFHATYIEDNGIKKESGAGNAIVGSYLSQLNLSEEAIIFATSASADTVNWLTNENAVSTGILVEQFDDTPDSSSVENNQSIKKNEVSLFEKIGAWTVAVDPSMGNACFLYSGFANGSAVRFGYDARYSLSFYMMLFNNNWKSINIKEKYKASLRLDSGNPWTGDFTGIVMDGIHGLYIAVDADGLLKELAKSNQATIIYDGREIDKLVSEDGARGGLTQEVPRTKRYRL